LIHSINLSVPKTKWNLNLHIRRGVWQLPNARVKTLALLKLSIVLNISSHSHEVQAFDLTYLSLNDNILLLFKLQV